MMIEITAFSHAPAKAGMWEEGRVDGGWGPVMPLQTLEH